MKFPELTEWPVRNVYDPPWDATKPLENILNSAHNAYVVANWHPIAALASLLPKGAQDFTQPPDISQLLQSWQGFCQQHEKAGQAASYVALLPRLADANAAHPFFNTVRADLFRHQTVDSQGAPLRVVFIGDFLTLEATFATNPYSALGKELTPHIGYFAPYEPPEHAALAWLCGGDHEYLEYFAKANLPTDNETAWRTQLRRVAHQLAAELVSTHSSYALDQRLRHWIGAQEQLTVDQQQLLARMYLFLQDVLPGAYDKDDDNARYGWWRRAEAARWKPYPLLAEDRRALMVNGLIRADGHESARFRVSSPLVAYAVTRLGFSYNRWVAGSRAIKEATALPVDGYPGDAPSGLDQYLTALLDKAAGKDGEDDQWTVTLPPSTTQQPGQSGAQWYQRLPYPGASH